MNIIKTVKYNIEPTLMIHSFSSDIFPGDNISINIDNIMNESGFTNSFLELLKTKNINTITFDDGLYQQIPLIKLFKKNDFRVIFFPSGEFIRDDNIKPIIVENSIAHKQYHSTKTYPNTFMSSVEIWDLLYEKNEFGIHGWYHYNLNPKQLTDHIGTNNFRQVLKALKDDAERCSNLYIEYVNKEESFFIENGILNINYCTPYNCLNEYQKLYIDFLYVFLKNINRKITEIRINVFSGERLSLEHLLGNLKE